MYNETSYLQFNPNSQIKNTPDLNSCYKTLQTELETNNINNDYYRIHFNIPEYFDDVLYKNLYALENIDNIFKFYSENKETHSLNE